MKVAIIGYSTFEQSESIDAYKYFKQRGDDITIYFWEGNTKQSDLPHDVAVRLCKDKTSFEGLDDFDLIVRGAAKHPKYFNTDKPVTTVTNEFMHACHAPMIGVTGTKGKGTTSTLIAKILEAAGKNVFLGGNIGKPPLGMLPDITNDSIVILELSSFQLMDVTISPHIGVCLMVVPEHLNWHTDMNEYLSAKSNLFRYQSSEDIVVYNLLSENSSKVTSVSAAIKKPYAVAPIGQTAPTEAVCFVKNDTIYYMDQLICSTSRIALLGRHNLENICAAITAVWPLINGNKEAITSVITTFRGLEHRLEFVAQVGGVKYYDDSFSTTPETAIAALKSFDQPVIMIVGGISKGVPFDELADAIATNRPKQVLLIGSVATTIAELLTARGFTDFTVLGLTNMKTIVDTAKKNALANDVILLSTGCASYDMFLDYKDRGNQFKTAVLSL
jgi:UDP-N-acetylmuramoylalanine--D-glutamate ligase